MVFLLIYIRGCEQVIMICIAVSDQKNIFILRSVQLLTQSC